MTSHVTRRVILGTTLGTVASGVAQRRAQGTPAAAPLKGSGQVIVCTWGGVFTTAQRKAFFDPFTAATGIKVVTTGVPDAAKLKVMEETGNVEWDLVAAEAQMMYKAMAQNLLEPVDYGLIDRITPRRDLLAGAAQPYGIASNSFGWVLTWNTKSYAANPPQGWADFWNLDGFKGRRAVYAQPKPLLEIALVADGVPKDKLYPLDVNRAYAKLDKIKPHINVWVSDTGQFDMLMQNAEVDLLQGTLGRTVLAKQHGAPYAYTFNGGVWEQSYWVIPKGAPNRANAQKLMAWMTQPDVEAAFSEAFPVGVPNMKAYALMPPSVAETLPTAPQNLPKEFSVNAKWWADNLDAMNRRWLDWYSNR